MRSNRVQTLGIALVAVLPMVAHGQMVSRSSAGSPVTLSAPRPSSLPPVQMGSLPQRTFDRYGNGFGHRNGTRDGFPPIGSCSIRLANCFSRRFPSALVAVPYETGTLVEYAVPVPVYVPVPVHPPLWAPAPEKPLPPYDPTKSSMLTIGEGADGGGGVMRIDRLENNTLRLTWRGSARPIREARLFIADSSRKSLRSARVDMDTPSALFEIADFVGKIAYTGLTVVFADGAKQTTLVPYPPRANRQ